MKLLTLEFKSAQAYYYDESSYFNKMYNTYLLKSKLDNSPLEKSYPKGNGLDTHTIANIYQALLDLPCVSRIKNRFISSLEFDPECLDVAKNSKVVISNMPYPSIVSQEKAIFKSPRVDDTIFVLDDVPTHFKCPSLSWNYMFKFLLNKDNSSSLYDSLVALTKKYANLTTIVNYSFRQAVSLLYHYRNNPDMQDFFSELRKN
jgi:hypothetical protein